MNRLMNAVDESTTRRRKRDYAAEYAQAKRQANERQSSAPWQHHVRNSTDELVPPDVLAERDRAYGTWRGATEELLGDPPPGRSALERRTSEPLPKSTGHSKEEPMRQNTVETKEIARR